MGYTQCLCGFPRNLRVLVTGYTGYKTG